MVVGEEGREQEEALGVVAAGEETTETILHLHMIRDPLARHIASRNLQLVQGPLSNPQKAGGRASGPGSLLAGLQHMLRIKLVVIERTSRLTSKSEPGSIGVEVQTRKLDLVGSMLGKALHAQLGPPTAVHQVRSLQAARAMRVQALVQLDGDDLTIAESS